MATTIRGSGEMLDVHFPKGGIDLSLPVSKQPAKQLTDGTYVRTAPDGVNVRAFEGVTNRSRGGARAGIEKKWPLQVSGEEFIVQDLGVVAGNFTAPGANAVAVQTSQSGRTVLLVAVSQGRVFTTVPGSGEWIEANNNTGETPALNYSGIMFATTAQQRMFWADGINQVYYDAVTNTLQPWTATAGTFPVDANNNLPRLICTWRGRIVQSGLLLDPQNWFMTAIDNPFDFDFGKESPGPADAVAGNNAPLGQIGDVITTLIPFSDDILIFGGDHSIWQMKGDPADGGRSDLVTDTIGMAWGKPWCMDPYGNVMFVSNKMGIYRWTAGQQPVRISQAIEQLLQAINTGENAIRCLWDDRFQGMHVFVTPLAEPAPATHFFWEQRTGGWFKDVFKNNNHNPLCCCTVDGNRSDDRVPVIGSWDGYVRAVSPDAYTDDGEDIESYVIIGPFLTANLDDVTLYSIQAVLGEASQPVKYEILTGPTAEAALSAKPSASGILKAGRSLTQHVRRSGHAIWVKLSSSDVWAMETLRLRLGTRGLVRQRGR